MSFRLQGAPVRLRAIHSLTYALRSAQPAGGVTSRLSSQLYSARDIPTRTKHAPGACRAARRQRQCSKLASRIVFFLFLQAIAQARDLAGTDSFTFRVIDHSSRGLHATRSKAPLMLLTKGIKVTTSLKGLPGILMRVILKVQVVRSSTLNIF